MKGYELLKLIADKKIKENTRIKDNYNTYIFKLDSIGADLTFLTLFNETTNEPPDYSYFANNSNEFEIIEEDKKIEKLKLEYRKDSNQQLLKTDTGYLTMRKADVLMINKISELVDEVNKLKESKK